MNSSCMDYITLLFLPHCLRALSRILFRQTETRPQQVQPSRKRLGNEESGKRGIGPV